MTKPRLTLYLRPDCHLCEEFLLQLQQFLVGRDVALQVIDVDSDLDTAERFGPRVPLLAGDQGELCHYEFDQLALQTYLSPDQYPIKCPLNKGTG
ncbi:MAG: glutaredoxin family protein [Gammaproteobacteria bacterium]|nr:glutaredoxin family protein [Gammaproteobacteria bacterium]